MTAAAILSPSFSNCPALDVAVLGSAGVNALGRGTESVNEAALLHAAPLATHDTFTLYDGAARGKGPRVLHRYPNSALAVVIAPCGGRRTSGGEA